MLLFGPCSLPRSLFVSSPAHGILQGTGHPLLPPCPCLPLAALLFWLCFPSCSLPLYAHGAEHCEWHPHSLPSPSFVVCAPWDPRFSRLPPVSGLRYPPPLRNTMQTRCTHVTRHTPGPTSITFDVVPHVPLERHHVAAGRRCQSPRTSRCRGWPSQMPRGARPWQASAAPPARVSLYPPRRLVAGGDPSQKLARHRKKLVVLHGVGWRGRGHPGDIFTLGSPRCGTVPNPDPDIKEGNSSVPLFKL